MVDQARLHQPPARLSLSHVTLKAGTHLHRVHHSRFSATQYNPTGGGNARFSPIRNTKGDIVPTLYAGSSFQCAAMETVFHDVPFTPGLKIYQEQKLQDQLHSVIKLTQDLVLADLSAKALRRLGAERRHLIDTPASEYSYTRSWATAIHAFAPEVQGLRWISRQDDEAQAFMLFGDRLPEGAFSEHAVNKDLREDAATFSAVMALAEAIGVLLVPDDNA